MFFVLTGIYYYMSEEHKLSPFFKRRIDHHKFEKMMRKGIIYMYQESNSLEEFKFKLVKATLENYIYYKYNIDIEELPHDDVDNFIDYMVDTYEPVLKMYYHNERKNRGGITESNKDKLSNETMKDTFQDIVDNWDELSNHKNHNIKTIKYFVENPDEITELTYDEKGLEDGYHRLIASKILNKPRVKYTMLKEDTNKKLLAYQKLIDRIVDTLKTECEDLTSEGIHSDACDYIEVLNSVQVVDITRDNTIQLQLKYNNIRYINEYDFIYELKHELKKYGNVKIEVIDSINTHNRQF